jgi:hypothetical protein
MNQQHTPYGEQATAPQGWPSPATKTPWFKRTWVIAVGAGLLGIGIGAASAGADVKSTPEYEAVASDLSASEKELSEARAELSDTKAELTEIAGDVPEREAAVEKAEADLGERDEKLSKAEAAVKQREKAVGLVEKEIRDNTIPGDGVFEVGVDMKAGAYKTAGAADCYYAVNGDANGNDIRSNNITSGPATVAVSAGEFFETRRCDDWVLQR